MRPPTEHDHRAEYVARVNRVLDHIEANIGGELSLGELAAVAGFSPFHFHRIFRALVGETLNGFVQRVRIEKAAAVLILNPKKTVTEVAFDCGFSGSATFARAFRQAYTMNASEWRRGGYRRYGRTQSAAAEDSKKRKTTRKIGQDSGYLSLYHVGVAGDSANANMRRRESMFDSAKVQVRVEQMAEQHVAYVRHIGPYKGNPQLFQDLFARLMRWAGPRGLLRFPETKMLTIYHDSPEITDESKLRLDAAITVPADTQVEGEVGKLTIPAGKYAFARFTLRDGEYQQAWDYVFGRWLPDSGYQPADGPSMEIYYGNPEEHPEKKVVLDICIPVKPL